MDSFYVLKKITPLNEIKTKDCKALTLAIEQAEKSNFNYAYRLGACLVVNKKYILWGEPT